MTDIMAITKKQEQEWQAQEDAHTMARYQEIMQDKSRMSRAIKEANKQAQDLSKRANAMQNAAKMRPAAKMRTNARKR
jgi:hypothetical protein